MSKLKFKSMVEVGQIWGTASGSNQCIVPICRDTRWPLVYNGAYGFEEAPKGEWIIWYGGDGDCGLSTKSVLGVPFHSDMLLSPDQKLPRRPREIAKFALEIEKKYPTHPRFDELRESARHGKSLVRPPRQPVKVDVSSLFDPVTGAVHDPYDLEVGRERIWNNAALSWSPKKGFTTVAGHPGALPGRGMTVESSYAKPDGGRYYSVTLQCGDKVELAREVLQQCSEILN